MRVFQIDENDGALQTERTSTGHRKLLRDYKIKLGECTFTIAEGSITDFSSLPSFGRWVVRWSKTDVAGVLHDALYHDGLVTRREADWAWFLVARTGERDTRANWIQAVICWTVLRLGGWYVYAKHAKRRRTVDQNKPPIVSKDCDFQVSMAKELLLIPGLVITLVALVFALGPIAAAICSGLGKLFRKLTGG